MQQKLFPNKTLFYFRMLSVNSFFIVLYHNFESSCNAKTYVLCIFNSYSRNSDGLEIPLHYFVKQVEASSIKNTV